MAIDADESQAGAGPAVADNVLWWNSYVQEIPTAANPQTGATHDVGVLELSRQAVLITDAQIDAPGPVVEHANQAYLDMFCCERADVVGKSPRIGQGPLTDRAVLDRVRGHLADAAPIRAQVINYRFDHTPFRLRWTIDPVLVNGKATKFVAMMTDVTVDEKIRRRLAALDVILSGGPAASELAGAARHEHLAGLLASALDPVLAELGRATVDVNGASATTSTTGPGTETVELDVIPIGTVGSIRSEVHPHAVSLVDQRAMVEVAEYCNWLTHLPHG